MRHHTIALTSLILASFLTWAGPASAQGTSAPAASAALEPAIGKVLTVEGTATIEHTAAVVVQVSAPKGPAKAKIGDLVYTGDIIQTEADGKVGLVFSDGTALNVFSNARMELNEFVYHPNSTLSSSVFGVVKGAFTLVGGKMAKTGRIRVETPTATLGIRGTSAHVVVGADGSVRFSTLVEEKN